MLLVTKAPPDADQSGQRLHLPNSTPGKHSSRGWCVMEKNAGAIVKMADCLLDFRRYKGATDFDTCIKQMRAGREPPRSPPAFGEFMSTGVASDKIQFSEQDDAGLVCRLYQEGFVKTVNRVAAKGGGLVFVNLRWGDKEGAVLVEALRYAAEHCTFPRGAVRVHVEGGDRISAVSRVGTAGHEAEWRELKGKFVFT